MSISISVNHPVSLLLNRGAISMAAITVLIAALFRFYDDPQPLPEPPPPVVRIGPIPARAPAPVQPASAGTADTAGPDVDALVRLQSDLTVPVAGVQPEQLRDNFTELRGKRQHLALDIMAPRGTAVLSATSGRVIQLSKNGNGGNMVFATDASGQFMLFYAHLDRYADDLKSGMPLRRGQVIGYVGTTGNAPKHAPHLHFAIAWAGGSLRWSKGTPLDPRPLLNRAKIAAAER